MKPFVKWAGGKRQILDRIMKYINMTAEEDKYRYVEPFVGGGAVFFNLKPKKAIINDLNEDLMNAYNVIKSENYEKLILELKKHKEKYIENPDEYYYEVRMLDREAGWEKKYEGYQKAARMIFLNRTCYNGLYRVNLKGEFNTPIGRYLNPTICDEKNIKEIHDFFKERNIIIKSGSYKDVLEECGENDLIYIDPPYDYKDDDGFTKYQMSGFTFDDFKELKKYCDEAIDRGAYVVISNNATEKVLELFIQDRKYTAYYSDTFKTLRRISCKGEERKTGSEVVIVGVSYRIVPQADDMNKIIRLATAGESILKDKNFAKEVLKVTTERQVAYYMSALSFFGYILPKNEFSKEFLSLDFDEKRVKDDIYARLIEKKDFKKFYGQNASKKEISEYLKEQYKELSDATADRRASTIHSWLKWMKKFKWEISIFDM